MSIFVVSGLYYFNENTFELDVIEPNVFNSVEKANEFCKAAFLETIRGTDLEDYENNNELELEEYLDKNDNTISISIYNTDNGDRVIIGVSKVEVL